MTSSVTLTGSGVSLLGVGVALGGEDVPLGTLSISPPLPATGAASSTIAATGVYSVAAPSGFTARWNPGNISSTVTLFAILPNNVWSATFSTPVAGSYRLTITGTGPNTSVVVSSLIALS